MNFFIVIFIALAAIVVILLITALFLKKHYMVEREISIDRSKQEVFNYIKYLRNQDYYSKWVMTDPNLVKNFKGTDGKLGFVYIWNGNKHAGAGEQEITKLIEGEAVHCEIRFIRPFKGVANTFFILEALSSNQTKIKWGMSGTNSYPLNLMLLFVEAMLGKDLEQSLNNLKAILEKTGSISVTDYTA